jgi:hypothetical protein
VRPRFIVKRISEQSMNLPLQAQAPLVRSHLKVRVIVSAIGGSGGSVIGAKLVFAVSARL